MMLKAPTRLAPTDALGLRRRAVTPLTAKFRLPSQNIPESESLTKRKDGWATEPFAREACVEFTVYRGREVLSPEIDILLLY